MAKPLKVVVKNVGHAAGILAGRRGLRTTVTDNQGGPTEGVVAVVNYKESTYTLHLDGSNRRAVTRSLFEVHSVCISDPTTDEFERYSPKPERPYE